MSTIKVNNVASYTGGTVNISGSNILVHGDSTLGDGNGSDKITVNGELRSTSLISSSNSAYIDKLYVGAGSNTQHLAVRTGIGGGFAFGYEDDIKIQIGKGTSNACKFTGHITASGHISGSGTTDLTIGGNVNFTGPGNSNGLPPSDPGIPGQLYTTSSALFGGPFSLKVLMVS